jgi:hypothetical protein
MSESTSTGSNHPKQIVPLIKELTLVSEWRKSILYNTDTFTDYFPEIYGAYCSAHIRHVQ